MLSHKKFDFTLIILILAVLAAIWIITAQRIGSPEVTAPSLFEQEVALENAPAVPSRATWQGDHIREASLNWADYADTSDTELILPELPTARAEMGKPF